jgi:peroxiredoxin family protein
VITKTELITVSSGEARISALEEEVRLLKKKLASQRREDQVSIVCFSGEWDRLFAALTIAAGALSMGVEVHLFFTFWAVSALRCAADRSSDGKTFLQSVFSRLLPCGPERARLSRFNFGGLGRRVMKRVMKEQGVDDIGVLFEEVKELGAHLHLCDTTAGLFGLTPQELNGGEELDQCGVATFLSFALDSKTVLLV